MAKDATQFDAESPAGSTAEWLIENAVLIEVALYPVRVDRPDPTRPRRGKESTDDDTDFTS